MPGTMPQGKTIHQTPAQDFCSKTFEPLCRGLHQLANPQNFTVPEVTRLTRYAHIHLLF